VPFNVFEAERVKVKSAREEVATIRAEREALAARVAELEPLTSKVSTLEAAAAELGQTRELLALSRQGVADDDVIVALRGLHARHGGDADLPSWVAAQREAGESAHPVVRSLLGGAVATAAPPAATKSPNGAVPPHTGGGGAPVSLQGLAEAAMKGDKTAREAWDQVVGKELASRFPRR
jgi:hypothetical protein